MEALLGGWAVEAEWWRPFWEAGQWRHCREAERWRLSGGGPVGG